MYPPPHLSAVDSVSWIMLRDRQTDRQSELERERERCLYPHVITLPFWSVYTEWYLGFLLFVVVVVSTFPVVRGT